MKQNIQQHARLNTSHTCNYSGTLVHGKLHGEDHF